MGEVLDILAREVDNDRHIYLYREKGKWCAYEQSACQVSTILKGCRLEKVVFSVYEIMLVRAVFDYEVIHSGNLPPYISIVRAKENFLELRKRAGLEHDIFNYWKRVVTRGKKELVLATI